MNTPNENDRKKRGRPADPALKNAIVEIISRAEHPCKAAYIFAKLPELGAECAKSTLRVYLSQMAKQPGGPIMRRGGGHYTLAGWRPRTAEAWLVAELAQHHPHGGSSFKHLKKLYKTTYGRDALLAPLNDAMNSLLVRRIVAESYGQFNLSAEARALLT